MTDVLLAVGLPSLAIGFVIGWVTHGYLTRAQRDLLQSDRDLDRSPHINHDAPKFTFCTRCGRSDGTHTTACERARLDILVAPVRRRVDGAQGHSGLSDRFQSSAKTDRGGS